MMKKLACVLLFSLMATNIFAMPEYRAEMRNRLQQGAYSFSFKEMNLSTITRLVGSEKGVTFIIDPRIDTHKTASIRLKESHFLAFLEVGLGKLDLQYQVVGPNTIKILPK